ncbi:hypothetical protein APHAL10511_008641 [Amanita phalloides]|nr:hypothetical protein APHAL10511_008682 [Amanita phalloides]KAK2459341.1 hypothetical protein APHAL10511_008641 [Amanita phalloides]
MKFDCLLQKGWSVTELKKDLEHLSQQMIQTPSEYDMARRFVNALKPEIATKVIRHSYNPENSNLNAIFEAAKFVEEAHFYETWEEQKHAAFKNSENSSSKMSGYKPSSFQHEKIILMTHLLAKCISDTLQSEVLCPALGS